MISVAQPRTTIRRKLTAAMMGTSVAILVLTCAAFLVFEIVTFRRDILEGLTTRAEVIAANSTAALAFRNEDDATEVLAALHQDPRMVCAAVYDDEGRLFARYPADARDSAFPGAPEREGRRFGKGECVVYQPIVQGDLWLGTVFLKSDLSAMTERYRLYAWVVLMVLAGSSLVAYGLASWLQRRIAEPVLQLSATVRRVSEGRNYSVRAEKLTDDEIGLLTESFNAMLQEIEQGESLLRESEARMRAVLESALDCIVTIDAEGRIVEFNPAAEQVFERSRAEAIGAGFWDLVRPRAMRSARGTSAPLLTADSEILGKRFESTAVRKDGSEFPVELAITRIGGEGPLLFTGFVRDITERAQAEEDIRRLNAELERRVADRTAQLEASNKELEAFSYSVSHDLRAPLRAIDGFSKAILDDWGNRVEGTPADYLRRIRAATQRMGLLIDDLLKLARLSRGELSPSSVSLSKLAQEVADELKQWQPQRDVSFDIQDDLVVKGDAQLLRVVVDNLLRNSWKYTSKHSSARIQVGSKQSQGAGVYFVRDDGAGFDMTHANQLFAPFQRLHRQTEFEGTGVGLATVQRIIRRHGGRVWAESEVEKGATFHFTLWET